MASLSSVGLALVLPSFSDGGIEAALHRRDKFRLRQAMARQVMKTLTLILALLLMNSAIAATESSVTYRSIRVDNLDIFYRESGPKDGLTILLLHGLPSSSRMFQPLLESSLSDNYHLIAPDYPGFGHSSWPTPKDFTYTFDSLAKVMQDFADELQLIRYTLFLQDYGGPVGFRMALAHPEKVQAMIIQNAVSHEEGLSPLWAVRRAFWEDRSCLRSPRCKNRVEP